jgi:hypothetical protein
MIRDSLVTDTPLLILRPIASEGLGVPEFIPLSAAHFDRSMLRDEEQLSLACHWALELPPTVTTQSSPRYLKFACQTSTDYLDWIRVVESLWR